MRIKLKWFIPSLISTLLLLSTPATVVLANAPSSNSEINVALFMKTNRFQATSNSGAVTISASGGMVLHHPTSASWLQTEDQRPIRASIDGFRILVTATANRAKADAIYSTLLATGQPIAIVSHPVKGNPTYRIYVGPFGDLAQADAIRSSLNGNANLLASLEGNTMKLMGPIYANYGNFPSEDVAIQAAIPMWDAGLYVIPAWRIDETGIGTYTLLSAEALNEAELKQWITEWLSAQPSWQWTPLSSATQFALLRTEHAGESALSDGIRRIDIGGAEMKLTFVPRQSNATLKIVEKSNRTYRGAIDILSYNGALAAINRVEMESYVASVVGSELDSSWPSEVLKAQAVAARTYALKQGRKYGIAQVVDTTLDQAYRGTQREFPETVAAAQATAGERLKRADGSLFDTFYHSNAGNLTADPLEVWNVAIPGISSKPSPDNLAERGKLKWFRIVAPDLSIGYVRSDLIQLYGETAATGFKKGVIVGDNVNVRAAPFINNETNRAIFQLRSGQEVIVIGEDIESTAYHWIRGPFSADRLLLIMKASGVGQNELSTIQSLSEVQVMARGAMSGRVTGLSVNGRTIPVSRGEQYRTLFDLPSSRFEVEEMSKLQILGSKGRTNEVQAIATHRPTVSVLSAGGKQQTISSDAFLIQDGDEMTRVATRNTNFRFHGFGFGHGLGMSQWGAYGLAELGYDYRQILQYYYQDATLVKE
jgi:stage II sporulation protein D